MKLFHKQICGHKYNNHNTMNSNIIGVFRRNVNGDSNPQSGVITAPNEIAENYFKRLRVGVELTFYTLKGKVSCMKDNIDTRWYDKEQRRTG